MDRISLLRDRAKALELVGKRVCGHCTLSYRHRSGVRRLVKGRLRWFCDRACADRGRNGSRRAHAHVELLRTLATVLP